MLLALLVPLVLGALVMLGALVRAAVRQRIRPSAEGVAIGAVTNFFDTLGIGSFAPTMAWLKFRKLVPDRILPATMLVGHTPPAMTQGIVFLILLGAAIDPVLLIGCSVALVAGALLGAGMVTRARVRVIQVVVAVALIVAAFFFALANLGLMPGGGTATSLPLVFTIVAIVASFIFGILANFGVGNYAPSLAMFGLMGLDPRYVFPIMAVGAGLAGAGASTRHILAGKIDLRIATGILIGGIPAVFVAALIVKEMPIEILRWLVVVVVLYAAAVMLRSAFRADGPEPADDSVTASGG